MDTIQISMKISQEKMNRISLENLQEVRRFINSIVSPSGYTYCDCLEISVSNNIVIKISYPRFYAGINAFLISRNSECMQVQNHFCNILNNHSLLNDGEINLSRVDIPFTFIMPSNYNFYSYRKIYQIFDYVYRKKNSRSNPKAYCDIQNFHEETLIYANTPNVTTYNSKITIYDQYNNIQTKTADEKDLHLIRTNFKDLSQRMRIEVSKRIKRSTFTIEKFRTFNIFAEYMPKYRNHILENIMDLNEVENFYNESAVDLAVKLLNYRETAINFNYENFILQNISEIYDYEIIRRALKMCIENVKTREAAVTAIRKVLNRYQLNENIILMETVQVIMSIKSVIENYYIGI